MLCGAEDPDIVHVDGSVDPMRDIEVINLELVLADLAQIEKRLEKTKGPQDGAERPSHWKSCKNDSRRQQASGGAGLSEGYYSSSLAATLEASHLRHQCCR